MTLLETWFLRQFRADGTGFVVVRGAREARFTADEVAGLVEDWRDLWLAPWLWAGWLLIGVAAPAWLAWNDYGPGAWTLGLLAAMFMIAVLAPVWLKPGEMAEKRLPFEPDVPRPAGPPSWLGVIGPGFVCVMSGYAVVRSGGQDLSKISFFLIWAGLFLLNASTMLLYRWGKTDEGNWRFTPLLLIGATGAGVVTVTALNPNREGFDVVVASIFPIMVALFALAALWQRFRPRAQNAA